MQQLPKWTFPFALPSALDTESLTPIEMNARMYGAMKALIDEHNKWVDEVNKQLAEFTKAEEQKRKDYEENLAKLYFDYRCRIEKLLSDFKAEITGGSA